MQETCGTMIIEEPYNVCLLIQAFGNASVSLIPMVLSLFLLPQWWWWFREEAFFLHLGISSSVENNRVDSILYLSWSIGTNYTGDLHNCASLKGMNFDLSMENRVTTVFLIIDSLSELIYCLLSPNKLSLALSLSSESTRVLFNVFSLRHPIVPSLKKLKTFIHVKIVKW